MTNPATSAASDILKLAEFERSKMDCIETLMELGVRGVFLFFFESHLAENFLGSHSYRWERAHNPHVSHFCSSAPTMPKVPGMRFLPLSAR